MRGLHTYQVAGIITSLTGIGLARELKEQRERVVILFYTGEAAISEIHTTPTTPTWDQHIHTDRHFEQPNTMNVPSNIQHRKETTTRYLINSRDHNSPSSDQL